MEIQSVLVWKDGVKKSAVELVIHSEFDDMESRAKFAYRLFTKDSEQVASGYVDLDGEGYPKWDGTNKMAYEIVAESLNLKLVI
jgi:hypothetical protein